MSTLCSQLISDLSFFRLMSIKPNFSELSRKYGSDRRTITKYYDGYVPSNERAKRGSMLDEHKETILEKLSIPGITSVAIYEYLKDQGKTVGSQSNFRKYCSNLKKTIKPPKSTMRYETAPGKQAQVDWKENMKLISKHGEVFEINIFVYVLGYSRIKYNFITVSREQKEVFKSLIKAFEFTGGVPESILFDNMPTVIDSLSTKHYKINAKMKAFADDFGFKIKRCKPRRPETKGKVESAVRFSKRLLPYNNEFETLEDLQDILKRINLSINQEKSQATGMPPFLLLQKEKEYLKPLPNKKILNHYLDALPPRIVSKDSTISYNGNKYSVPIEYIGKKLTVSVLKNVLHIYYNVNLIRTHPLDGKKLNYHQEDYFSLVNATFKDDTDIETMAQSNLSLMDSFYGKD